MKKIMLIAVCIAAMLMLNACVPTEETQVYMAPQIEEGPVEFDFIKLHNDTLSLFDGYDMYSFVDSLDISGDFKKKMIYVECVVPADMEEEVIDVFAAAVLRRINDAAMGQDFSLQESTALDMGDLWKEYGCKLTIYGADKNGEQGDVIKEIKFKAGEKIGLSPDTETYEEKWRHDLEILERNAE